MSDLKIGPLRPSFAEAHVTEGLSDEPKLDFGPDFTVTPEKQPPPKINVKNPPKPAEKAFKPLGQNKKLRSPVRRLTREAPNGETKSDFELLVDWYHRIGNMAQMFHPKFAVAMHEQAEDCADSWFILAEKNDAVRRYILGMVEGGGWMKVVGAHAPIFMALIPQATLERFFLKGMGLFARNVEAQQQFEEMNNGFGFTE